tara:strand:- start:321 stop:1238 length:918 start_codon:yes stop_codon:yes gene_type:complete
MKLSKSSSSFEKYLTLSDIKSEIRLAILNSKLIDEKGADKLLDKMYNEAIMEMETCFLEKYKGYCTDWALEKFWELAMKDAYENNHDHVLATCDNHFLNTGVLEYNPDSTLLIICREHGAFYSSIIDLLGIYEKEIKNCPKCPKQNISNEFSWESHPKLNQEVYLECTTHGKFKTTPKDIIGSNPNNTYLNCRSCPECPEYIIAENNFGGIDKNFPGFFQQFIPGKYYGEEHVSAWYIMDNWDRKKCFRIEIKESTWDIWIEEETDIFTHDDGRNPEQKKSFGIFDAMSMKLKNLLGKIQNKLKF